MQDAAQPDWSNDQQEKVETLLDELVDTLEANDILPEAGQTAATLFELSNLNTAHNRAQQEQHDTCRCQSDHSRVGRNTVLLP